MTSNSISRSVVKGGGWVLPGFLSGLQPVTFTHGDISGNHYFIGIVPNAVQNRFGDCTFAVFVRINPCAPSIGFILGAENHRFSDASCLSNFKQVVRFLWSQLADQPFTSGTEQYLITCKNKKYIFLLTTTLTISDKPKNLAKSVTVE